MIVCLYAQERMLKMPDGARKEHCKQCGKPLEQGSSWLSIAGPKGFCNNGCKRKWKRRGRENSRNPNR